MIVHVHVFEIFFQGENLQAFLLVKGLRVNVANDICNITSITPSSIVCTPPKSPSGLDGNSMGEVTVSKVYREIR